MKTELLPFLLFGAVGCNAIFGITEGTLGSDTGAGTQGGGGGTTSSQGGDGGTPSNGGAGGGQGGIADGGGGAVSNGGNGGDGGQGGGVVAQECNPENLGAGESIGVDCGVFVKKGATGTGTKADPMGTISGALSAVPHGKGVYVCGGDTFTGSGRLEQGSSLIGGLDCDWTRKDTFRPILLGDSGSTALLVTGDATVTARVQDFFINGGGPVPFKLNSIAVFVVNTNVEFERVDIMAPAAGTGADASPQTTAAPNGPTGAGANAICQSIQPPGGQNTCTLPDGTTVVTSGGNGAICNSTANTVGDNGQPMGFGGIGGSFTGGSCSNPMQMIGSNGQPGALGPQGIAGGAITNSDYLLAASAPQAGNGGFGGGGGGGGARFGNTGGGGGAGGCGGVGGGGGGAGGGNFPVMLYQSSANFINSHVTANRGGQGGRGEAGQQGGFGGGGGVGLGVGLGCTGGNGGNGARGGIGGGGPGGPSAIVGMTSDSTATADAMTKSQIGGITGGQGGQGGFDGLGGTGQTGQNGLQCQLLLFNAASGIWTCGMFP